MCTENENVEIPTVAPETPTTSINEVDDSTTETENVTEENLQESVQNDRVAMSKRLEMDMMTNDWKLKSKRKNKREEIITSGEAKDTPWFIVRHLFDEVVSEIVSAAQSAVTSENWSALEHVEIPVTINENCGKYCCWECGGAKQTFGHSFIIGEPSGNKPLAISAFRKGTPPNGKQAVIYIWPSCMIAISTQSRGIGATLLYKVTGVKVKESPYIQTIRDGKINQTTEGTIVKHYVITCQLNKVFNMATDEVSHFCNDLSHINAESDIIKAAVRKSTIYNCDQAIYIRPFYKVNNGHEDWDISTLTVEKTLTESNQISSKFMEILSNLSSIVRKMPNKVYPYIGMEILYNDEPENDDLFIKIALLTANKCNAWIFVMNKSLFHKHRDFFLGKSYEQLLDLRKVQDPLERTFIYRYTGN